MNKSGKILYHYTSLEGFLGIIESKSIWATNVLYLNDASELKYSIELFNDQIRKHRKKEVSNTEKYIFFENQMQLLHDFLLPNIYGFYVCSFSEENDLLSQWRGYSQKSIGISLGFNLTKLKIKNKAEIISCIYDEKTQINQIKKNIKKHSLRFNEIFKNKKHLTNEEREIIELDLGVNFENDIINLATIIKHPKYKEEKEWRMVTRVNPWDDIKMKFRTGPSMLVPFIENPLPKERNKLVIDHIVLGPTYEPRLSKASVEMLLRAKNVKFKEIQYSSIPYRNW